MNRKSHHAQLLLLLLPALAGCAQFTTSSSERAQLQAAADAADAAYLDCLDRQAARYLDSGENAQAIVTVARKGCTTARDVARQAQSALQSTNYILAEREVEAGLAALDARGEAAITEQLLNRRALAPAATAATPKAVVAAVPGPAAMPSAPAGGDAYLACMQDQGERWATVDEPAAVIADAAHSRCAGRIGGALAPAEIEKAGRALVVGVVLDRKAQAQATRP